MFKTKQNKKIWTILILLLVLVAIIIVLQTQMLAMLQDLQTTVFNDMLRLSDSLYNTNEWMMDSNPLPPAKTF